MTNANANMIAEVVSTFRKVIAASTKALKTEPVARQVVIMDNRGALIHIISRDAKNNKVEYNWMGSGSKATPFTKAQAESFIAANKLKNVQLKNRKEYLESNILQVKEYIDGLTAKAEFHAKQLVPAKPSTKKVHGEVATPKAIKSVRIAPAKAARPTSATVEKTKAYEKKVAAKKSAKAAKPVKLEKPNEKLLAPTDRQKASFTKFVNSNAKFFKGFTNRQVTNAFKIWLTVNNGKFKVADLSGFAEDFININDGDWNDIAAVRKANAA
jgi:hypothetical protein